MATYLRKAFSTTGNRQKFSLSMWVKRASGLGVEQMLCECYSGSSAKDEIWLQTNNTINFVTSNPDGLATTSSAEFKDASSWYHFLFAGDSTQASNANRIKIYKNGVQQALAQQDTIPQNQNFQFGNTGTELTFGMRNATDWYFNGSMSNVEMVDGQQYGPEYFGSFDSVSGIWTPQASSTISDYGTNGFKLKMDTTSPGADTSGKGNTFTASGTPTLTQGSPSNNYACMNPLKTQNGYSLTMNNGNLRVRQGQGGQTNSIPCTMPVKKGKWYVEVQPVSSLSNSAVAFGIGQAGYGGSFLNGEVGGFPGSLGGVHYNNSGNIQWYASGDQSTSTGTTFTGGSADKIAIALDCDNTKIYWYKNNVLVNSGGFDYSVCTGSFDSPFTTNKQSIVGEYVVFMMAGNHSSGDDVVVNWNFGDGFFATAAAGTNADGNGQGLFAYPPPTGYYALNTKNLEAYG